MQSSLIVCAILAIIYVSICNCSTSPIRIKRTAQLNVGNTHGIAFDDRNPEFIRRMRQLVPNFDVDNKRFGKRSLRVKRDEYEDSENEESYYYPPEFYVYKNVGSLYVDGKNVKIEKPMYNFGVDNYGYPPYGYPESEPYDEYTYAPE